ncbi:MAG: hypothetical protein GYB66_02050 [Chloroflexi bacterium]|nr:hypothetical protein [Chloroflexota bacterium]
MERRLYPPSRAARKQNVPLDARSMREVGLGVGAQFFVFSIALFPLVGLVIGFYYSSQDHYGTRSLGRTLLAYAFLLHFVYFCVACPLLFYLALA